jgi:UPF0755 protein
MIKKMIYAFILVFLILALAFLYAPGGVYGPVHREKDQAVIIEKGRGMQGMAEVLAQEKVIAHPLIFFAASLIQNQWGKLKAGEFLIPKEARPIDIVRILHGGRVIVHKLTFPEGNTVTEMMEQIQNQPLLKGEITHTPAQGFMLPATYPYIYGDTRQSLVDRMEAAMISVLAEAWAERQEELPYQNSLDALILASIVEKETGHPDERARIASVFVNRLFKKMRLQADPTVIYGITLGKVTLKRQLTKKDLTTKTPYNTYVIDGLPPLPICCPGKAAIQAALNPLETQDLYFVADGTGKHNFSAQLSQHNAFVDLYHREQKQRKR